MASIFRRKGERVYTISYFDAHGVRRDKSSRTSDFRAAERIAAKIEADIALRREGVVDVRHDRLAAHSQTSLREHVAAYVQHCLDAEQARVTISEKTRHLAWLLGESDWRMLLPELRRAEWPTAEQRAQTSKRKQPGSTKRKQPGSTPEEPLPVPISRRVSGPGWQRLADITAESLERALGALREAGLSARSCNFKREAAIAFASWCVRTERLDSNPLRLVRRLDASRDPRRTRRALTDAEMARLFAVADKRGRKLWYMLAALAALRRSEIARLTWADVDLESRTLTISRGKAKRTDVLALDVGLADELRRAKPELALPSARVLPTEMTNDTRRKDFIRAQIPLVDDSGFVADLHGLRTTLGTRLGRAGIAPQVAQRIMRHSDYRLTLRHYTRLTLDDSAAALSRLAPIGAAPAPDECAQATGTDEANASRSEHCPQKRPQSVHETAREDATRCDEHESSTVRHDERKPLHLATLRDEMRREAWRTRRDSNTQQPVPKTGTLSN